jgi:hypothetical protein
VRFEKVNIQKLEACKNYFIKNLNCYSFINYYEFFIQGYAESGYKFNEYEITSKKDYFFMECGDFKFEITLNDNEFNLKTILMGGSSTNKSFNLNNHAYLQDNELPCSLLYAYKTKVTGTNVITNELVVYPPLPSSVGLNQIDVYTGIFWETIFPNIELPTHSTV